MCTLKAAPEPCGFPKEQKPGEIARQLPLSFPVNARPLVIAAISSRAEKGIALATNIDNYVCVTRAAIAYIFDEFVRSDQA